MKKQDDIQEDFERDLTELYSGAVGAMNGGDADAAQEYLKEAVRLSTFQKRLNEAHNFLRKIGGAPNPTDSMSNFERTALLVEWAFGDKAKTAYKQKFAGRLKATQKPKPRVKTKVKTRAKTKVKISKPEP